MESDGRNKVSPNELVRGLPFRLGLSAKRETDAIEGESNGPVSREKQRQIQRVCRFQAKQPRILPKNCEIPAPRQGLNSEFCGKLRWDRANTGSNPSWRRDARNHQGKTAFSLA